MKKEKKKITCPECGKRYEIELEPGKRYTDVECECGAIVPLDPAAGAERVHVVKLELPEVTLEWTIATLKTFSRAWLHIVAPYIIGAVVLFFVIYFIMFLAQR